MVSLHRGRFIVVHFFVDPQNFPIGENLYQKSRFFAIFEAVGPHFKATTVKFGMTVLTWESFSHAKFYIKSLKGIPFWQIYTKNYQFRLFWGL